MIDDGLLINVIHQNGFSMLCKFLNVAFTSIKFCIYIWNVSFCLLIWIYVSLSLCVCVCVNCLFTDGYHTGAIYLSIFCIQTLCKAWQFTEIPLVECSNRRCTCIHTQRTHMQRIHFDKWQVLIVQIDLEIPLESHDFSSVFLLFIIAE